MLKIRAMSAAMLALVLAGCGLSDQWEIEEAVTKRIAENNATVTYISDAVIYRHDDSKFACVTGTAKNHWDEEIPPFKVSMIYILREKRWMVYSDPSEMEPGYDCTESLLERGRTILN